MSHPEATTKDALMGIMHHVFCIDRKTPHKRTNGRGNSFPEAEDRQAKTGVKQGEQENGIKGTSPGAAVPIVP